MPDFHNPAAFFGLLLAVPVALLYLRRRLPRRIAVGTGWLWGRVLAAAGKPSAWRRRRRAVSLAVQLAVLGLLVLALAEPQFQAPRQVAFVIDNSGGMGSLRPPGSLDLAKQAAQRRVAELHCRDQAAVVCTAGALRVRCGMTGSRRLLTDSIEAIHAGGGPACVVDAVRLARRIIEGRATGRIEVLADPGSEPPAELAGAADVEWVQADGAMMSAGGWPAPWVAIAAAALAVLVGEWFLFHRRWTE